MPVPAPGGEHGEEWELVPSLPLLCGAEVMGACGWARVRWAFPALSCRAFLPPHHFPGAQARPAEPSRHLLPPQHPAKLCGHSRPAPVSAAGGGRGAQGNLLCTPDSCLPTQAGAGPEEGGPVLPFSSVACGRGSLGIWSWHRRRSEACGPGSCLWAGGAELQALLRFPGTGERGWLCPATVAGTLPQSCTWDLVSIKCLQQNKPGCGCFVLLCCCQGLGLGAHWQNGARLGSRQELH